MVDFLETVVEKQMRSLTSYALAFLLVLPSAPGIAQQTQCFSGTEKPQFRVLQQAPPPTSESSRNYPYHPASMISTMRIDLLQTTRATMPMYYWQWANHGPRRVPKSNLAIGVHPRVGTELFFTSIERADACTMAQTAALFGDDAEVDRRLSSAQLTRQSDVQPGRHSDTCLIRDKRLPASTAGVLLDYEVFDGRTPKYTEDFLVGFADYVHSKGKKAILYTNPLNAPTQRLTGIDQSNASVLSEKFDLMSIFLWSRSREGDITASFAAQKAMLTTWRPEKMMIVFELNGTTLKDAADVAALMKENNISHLSLWRNYGKQGGSCDLPINRKISCIAFDRC